MGTRLRLAVPDDFVLARDACSYGYFLLWPNLWRPAAGVFERVLGLAGGPARIEISQAGPARRIRSRPANWGTPGAPLSVRVDRTLDARDREAARAQIARMLRLDESAALISAFHAADPRWAASGRGRLFRSPTLFEDVVKTVTSCNVQWPGTVAMNRRLCEVVGVGGAFPTPARLARTRPGTLRARCRVGYRDRRLIELSRLFVSGAVEPAWFEDPATPDDELERALLDLPGVGPYAAANIMQLLGRYHRLPLDTESVRHGKTILGFKGSSASVMKRVASHFAPMGAQAFRSYWFEMWRFYEAKRGPSWEWDRDAVGSSFTASQF